MNTALPSNLSGRNAHLSVPGIRRLLARALASRPATGLAMLMLLLAIGAYSLSFHFPRSVTPARAPAAVFSAERAMTHLPAIASEPHPAGSTTQAAVRDYLVQQLTALDLETEVQQVGRFQNVVVRLRGTDPTGAIVVLAPYDSQAAGPGAADNGAGVTALLEVMRALH